MSPTLNFELENIGVGERANRAAVVQDRRPEGDDGTHRRYSGDTVRQRVLRHRVIASQSFQSSF